MYTRFKKINSSGFTLVEIIASIAILGMVIAVLLPIFPQIMSWTQKTDEELVASNLLSEVANETEKVDVASLFGENIIGCENGSSEDVFLKDYQLNSENYEARINICEEYDVSLYRTHIKIYANDDRLVSESYTYILGDLK
ncbi:prepilin-type N-terminal cleavage/methylation domain-containing protein [Virgibacillus subterraneus]|uniref:Prepilin-type N-terminal cleavage/methylation domain-containing protein n=1 Tax=Virgibacillus subterraneus TaxID=621109 RepID=A0A1H9DBQ5_9BACI|nr:type II secretion system protein [Virgibacillus subterraneus]SEQ10904.1 prepilin-type N-terminal cleavage/methylation domain-containing protein [Virgibacillus subterraneus]